MILFSFNWLISPSVLLFKLDLAELVSFLSSLDSTVSLAKLFNNESSRSSATSKNHFSFRDESNMSFKKPNYQPEGEEALFVSTAAGFSVSVFFELQHSAFSVVVVALHGNLMIKERKIT